MIESNRSAISILDTDLDALTGVAEKQIGRINGNLDLEQVLKGLTTEETYRTTPLELQLIYKFRHAICIYIWFSKWLFIHSGQEADAGKLDIPINLVRAKQRFSSSYALAIIATLLSSDCDKLLTQTTNLAHLKPQFSFDVGANFTQDLQLILSYYVDALQSDDGNGIKLIRSSIDIISITKDFWECVAAKAFDELNHTDPQIRTIVANVTFKHNDFVVSGFTIEKEADRKTINFSPVQPEEIVGNTEAVIMLLRLCDRLALYDPEIRKNPMCEIGGLYESNLLDGPPGTGKTSLTKMAITRLSKRGEQLGLAYWFTSLDAKATKSSWYGESAKILGKILEDVINPTRIALLVVDDVDLLLSPRDDLGTGSADRDLLKGLMDFFSGVSTNYIGNYSSIAATNKPTGVDDALRQRFVYRVQVTGAETWEDYADLVALQLKKPTKYGLVKIGNGDYTPLQRTRPKSVMDHKKLYSKTGTWADIGHCIMELHSKNSQFTARSVKNSMDVIIAKAGDFDLPEEFFSNPTVFVKQPWERRIAILKELFGEISTDTIINGLMEQADSEGRYKGTNYLTKRE